MSDNNSEENSTSSRELNNGLITVKFRLIIFYR